MRGRGRLVLVYADAECPFCARLVLALRDLPVRTAFRHFPIRSQHPRAWPAARALEAAARQDAFWGLLDGLLCDQGRLEDPHLWAHAERLGLDLDAFEADRRSAEVEARVRRDLESGIRAGAAGTPTVFLDGERLTGDGALARLLR